MIIRNVFPTNDTHPHVESTDCWCKPKWDEETGEHILIHNSFDGREIFEELEQPND